MEQIHHHGIRPSPGEGQPSLRDPGQQGKPHGRPHRITGQPERRSIFHRTNWPRLIQNRNSRILQHPRRRECRQPQKPQRHQPQPLPVKARLHHHAQPEIGKEHHRPGPGEEPPQPGHIPRQTPQQDGHRQNQPFPLPSAEPEPEPCRPAPPEEAQQIPKMPPGRQPFHLPTSKQHRDALAQQIQRQCPHDGTNAVPSVPEKQPRQEREKRHMYQINHLVLEFQCPIPPDPGLDPMSVYHAEYQKQLQIAITGAA